jgi:hypothetical protein
MHEFSENIILHKYYQKDGSKQIIEVSPDLSEKNPDYVLSIDSSGYICWGKIPLPEIPEFPKIEFPEIPEVIENDRIRGTEIYYKDGKVGISRLPLHTYKFDIAVPENTLMTAFHVGDGKYGFSMGNGTSQGFIPEIIGIGSDENDAGLYFIGKTSSPKESGIPLVVIDGRRSDNTPSRNRPLFGVTNADYSNYKLIINQDGNVGIGCMPGIYKVEIQGSIQAQDFVLDGLSVKALIDIIKEHEEEIDKLKNKIESLEQQK